MCEGCQRLGKFEEENEDGSITQGKVCPSGHENLTEQVREARYRL